MNFVAATLLRSRDCWSDFDAAKMIKMSNFNFDEFKGLPIMHKNHDRRTATVLPRLIHADSIQEAFWLLLALLEGPGCVN